MKIEGRFLLFETPCAAPFPHIFPKECEIIIPEKVPIIWDFKPWNPDNAIGTAEVIRDEDGLYMKGEITKDIPEVINGLGGFYNHLKFGYTERNVECDHMISKAKLDYISITPTPVNTMYRFKRV